MHRAFVLIVGLGAAGCDVVFGGQSQFDAKAADAAPDGSATVDTDGDGVFDDTDNCRMASNQSQHDEDSDAIGDACDNCPYTGGETNDIDTDGVGDACDPDAAAAHEQWHYFDGYGDARTYPCTGSADASAGWTCMPPSTGMVQVANDDLLMDEVGEFIVEDWSRPETIRWIETSVRATSTDKNQNFVRVMGRTGEPATFLGNYVGCGVDYNQVENQAMVYAFHVLNGTQVTQNFVLIGPWPPPERIDLRFEIPDSADPIARCRATWSGGGPAETSIPLAVANRPRTIGLWANHMTARYEYLGVLAVKP